MAGYLWEMVAADLTGKPLSTEQMLNNVVSLAELLILYQDSRTIIMAVPQAQLYTFDPAHIKEATLNAARKQLDNFNVLIVENGTDYLEAAFEAQLDIREIPGRQPKRSSTGRPLENAILFDRVYARRKSTDRNNLELFGCKEFVLVAAIETLGTYRPLYWLRERRIQIVRYGSIIQKR